MTNDLDKNANKSAKTKAFLWAALTASFAGAVATYGTPESHELSRAFNNLSYAMSVTSLGTGSLLLSKYVQSTTKKLAKNLRETFNEKVNTWGSMATGLTYTGINYGYHEAINGTFAKLGMGAGMLYSAAAAARLIWLYKQKDKDTPDSQNNGRDEHNPNPV
jgi:hypothetical protein